MQLQCIIILFFLYSHNLYYMGAFFSKTDTGTGIGIGIGTGIGTNEGTGIGTGTTTNITNSSSVIQSAPQSSSPNNANANANVTNVIYDIRNHKEYPALVKKLEKDCDKINMIKKIDDLNKQILDLRLSLKYFDIPNSREYKELLYKYNTDIPKVYFPKSYPTSYVNTKISKDNYNYNYQNDHFDRVDVNERKAEYNITDWTKNASFPAKLNLLNIVDTYPYS
jgi:hypothetical protein